MPAWILPTHEPLQTQPGAAGLAQTQPCPKAAKAPAGANNTRVCKGVLHTEIQIPDALQWEGTFMLCFNLNVSTAQSDELTAQVCPAPGQHMLKWVLSPTPASKTGAHKTIPFLMFPQGGRLDATPHGSPAQHQLWLLLFYLHIKEVGLQQSGAGVASEEKHQLGLLQVPRGQCLLHLPWGQGKPTHSKPRAQHVPEHHLRHTHAHSPSWAVSGAEGVHPWLDSHWLFP